MINFLYLLCIGLTFASFRTEGNCLVKKDMLILYRYIDQRIYKCHFLGALKFSQACCLDQIICPNLGILFVDLICL